MKIRCGNWLTCLSVLLHIAGCPSPKKEQAVSISDSMTVAQADTLTAPIFGEYENHRYNAKLIIAPGTNANTFGFAFRASENGFCSFDMKGSAYQESGSKKWVFRYETTPCTLLFSFSQNGIYIEEPNPIDCGSGADCQYGGHYTQSGTNAPMP